MKAKELAKKLEKLPEEEKTQLLQGAEQQAPEMQGMPQMQGMPMVPSIRLSSRRQKGGLPVPLFA